MYGGEASTKTVGDIVTTFTVGPSDGDIEGCTEGSLLRVVLGLDVGIDDGGLALGFCVGLDVVGELDGGRVVDGTVGCAEGI